ncbi:hypothetical protein GCM10023116_12520 [Kistimonas scapharcae]|uniref:Phage protein n=1 Tax=Kistimonas scapharcae TaxID=1036133 RepID=A0ABP8UYH3_9GAMM
MINECYRVFIKFKVNRELDAKRRDEVMQKAWSKIIQLRMSMNDCILYDSSVTVNANNGRVVTIVDNKQAAEDFHRELMNYFGKFTYLTVVEEE